MKNHIQETDKVYWHKYISYYEPFLPENPRHILEIGVFKGGSIQFWKDRYEHAKIYGIDIKEESESWPKHENIKYYKLDQSDCKEYEKVLKDIKGKLDIVIEDGSHDPMHQKISLMATLEYMNAEGIYIMEDIQTSHYGHPLYKNRVIKINKKKSLFNKKSDTYLMTLQALLLLENLKTNNKSLDAVKNQIDFRKSIFSYEELNKINEQVKSIHLYRRSVLPNYCYSCKTDNFDYVTLKCNCGVNLMEGFDSMTAVLKIN